MKKHLLTRSLTALLATGKTGSRFSLASHSDATENSVLQLSYKNNGPIQRRSETADVMSSLSTIECIILGLTFLVCLSLIWSSLRAGITPVPSSRRARQVILSAAAQSPAGSIIELGSGWGQLALALAAQYPQRHVIGYEISLIPWLVSLLLKKLYRLPNLSLRRENFLRTKLPHAALLVCYLYPGGMTKLARKLGDEPTADMLISNTFALPGQEPEQIIRLDDLYKSPIYVYCLQRSDVEKRDVKVAEAEHQTTVE